MGLDEDIDTVRDKKSADIEDVEIIETCQKTSSSQSVLTSNNKQVYPTPRRFRRIVASQRPCLKCYCGKTFGTRGSLMFHIRQDHRNSQTVQKKKVVDVQCPDCKVIMRRSSLTRH